MYLATWTAAKLGIFTLFTFTNLSRCSQSINSLIHVYSLQIPSCFLWLLDPSRGRFSSCYRPSPPPPPQKIKFCITPCVHIWHMLHMFKIISCCKETITVIETFIPGQLKYHLTLLYHKGIMIPMLDLYWKKIMHRNIQHYSLFKIKRYSFLKHQNEKIGRLLNEVVFVRLFFVLLLSLKQNMHSECHFCWPIVTKYSISIPPENFRKSLVFLTFLRGIEMENWAKIGFKDFTFWLRPFKYQKIYSEKTCW